jgi:hypothetical protein
MYLLCHNEFIRLSAISHLLLGQSYNFHHLFRNIMLHVVEYTNTCYCVKLYFDVYRCALLRNSYTIFRAQHVSYPISFRNPCLFCLLTVGVEVVYFHLITLKTHSQ